jgi:hypothetical protein
MQMSVSSTRRLGAVTAVWGVIFAACHFYWAVGGTFGTDQDGQGVFASLYIGFIAAIGLASVAVALGLHQPWGVRVGRSRLRLLARVGGTLLFLGVAVGVGQWIAEASIGDDGAGGVTITAYFLLGALLFSALGWLADVSPGADAVRSATPRAGGADGLHAERGLS